MGNLRKVVERSADDKKISKSILYRKFSMVKKAKRVPEPARYKEFLTFVFDRPIPKSQDEDVWYREVDTDFSASDLEIVELYSYLFRNAGQDLEKYSYAQVEMGLTYLFNPGCSDMVHALRSEKVDEKKQIEAVKNITYLYKDYFAYHCTSTLSYINELGGTPVNSICYMIWDVTSINYFEKEKREDKKEYLEAIFEVLETALYISNEACIESALHGLGHMHLYYSKQTTAIIDRFIQKRPNLRPALKKYAEHARTGCVN